MNNSKLIVDLQIPSPVTTVNVEQLRQEETRLTNLIAALRVIQKTKEWSTLKTELFDGLTVTLEKQLQTEAKKENPDQNKLNRLAGQLKWAEKFSDLKKLEEVLRIELSSVKQHLHGKTEA